MNMKVTSTSKCRKFKIDVTILKSKCDLDGREFLLPLSLKHLAFAVVV